jgi:tetratricopeptide (TPR) repeat protein
VTLLKIMGLGNSKETHFSLLKKAEGTLSHRGANKAQLEAALDQCRLAMDESPTYPLTYMILAKLLMRLGRYREAADATVECIELSPQEMYSMYFMLADCLEACDEYEAAVAAISKVPKGRRAELKETHERRKKYLVQSVPPVDGRDNSSPLAPPHEQHHGTSDVELKSQVSYSDGMSLDHLIPSDQSSLAASVASMRRADDPLPLPPLGPSVHDDRDEQDRTLDEWYENRDAEHGAAMKRDSNYLKFLHGKRRQYMIRPVDRTRMKRIGEHRAQFARLSTAQSK